MMKLILGHNQFIGISHISEEKSKERDVLFSKVENIYNLIEYASDLGFSGAIIETHPRMLEFLEYYKKNRTFDIDFYLQVPYIQGYIQRMNEIGIKNLIFDLTRQAGLVGASRLALSSAIGSLKKDYLSMALAFLKLETFPFEDLHIKSILLHNVVTDLLLALDIGIPFSEYIEYSMETLELAPGFITLNFPLLLDRLRKWNLTPSFVMTPVNPKGYDMNPSKDAVELAIKEYKGNIIAMNVLGGGAFSLDEARSYLGSFDNIEYCVVGASSRDHLEEAFISLK